MKLCQERLKVTSYAEKESNLTVFTIVHEKQIVKYVMSNCVRAQTLIISVSAKWLAK